MTFPAYRVSIALDQLPNLDVLSSLILIDGGTLAIPTPDEPGHGKAPWPHSDQSAYRYWPHCIQGLLNLLPNGPEDGGLAVMSGTAPLFEQYFKEHQPVRARSLHVLQQTNTDKLSLRVAGLKKVLFNWTDKELKWFKDRGCEWVKSNMEPGDFILWDSRAVHYGAAPLGNNKRMAVSDRVLTEEQRQRKVEAFKRGYMTSHDPTDFVLKEDQMAD